MAAPAKSDLKDEISEDDSSLFLEALCIPPMPSESLAEQVSAEETGKPRDVKSSSIRPLMEGVEIPKPSGKVVPLMALNFNPTEKTEDDDEEAPQRKSKKHYRPKKQIRNIFTRMEDAEYGPLSVLHRSVEENLKVKVWTRSYRHVRGICTGYIVAFDKHWNLAMADVDEIYRKPIPRRTAWTMNIRQDTSQETSSESKADIESKEIEPTDELQTVSGEDYNQEFQSDGDPKEEKSEHLGDDSADLSAELQTLSLLKEKLAQLDNEEGAEKKEEKRDKDRKGTRKDDTKKERTEKSKEDRDRSSRRSQRESPDRSPRLHRDTRERLRRRSRSQERSPRSGSRRYERKESPRRDRNGSSHWRRKGDSPGSGRDHTTSRRHRDKDSPYSSRDSSPNRHRGRTHRRSRSRTRSATPNSDRDSGRKGKDLRERLSSRSSSGKSRRDLDLREKLHGRQSSSRRDRSPRDVDMQNSPSKNTRSRAKQRPSSPKSSRDNSRKESTSSRHSREKPTSSRKNNDKTKSKGLPSKSRAAQSSGSEGAQSNEPSFVTVGSQTIIKRHVNQLFIRGDNVVMVSIVD